MADLSNLTVFEETKYMMGDEMRTEMSKISIGKFPVILRLFSNWNVAKNRRLSFRNSQRTLFYYDRVLRNTCFQ